MSSNDSVAGGGGSDSDGGAIVVRGSGGGGATVKTRQRRPNLRVYVVVSDKAGGFWRGCFTRPTGGGDAPQQSVVALALVHIVASPLGSSTSSPVQQRLRDLALERARRATVEGFLEYKIEALCRLETPVVLPGGETGAPRVLGLLGGQACVSFVMPVGDAASTESSVEACLGKWQAEAGNLLPPAIVFLTAALATLVAAGATMHLHCVALTGKIERKRLVVQDDAPRKRLKQWRDELQQTSGAPAAPAAPVLVEKHWGGSRGVRSPEVMLQWLDCSQDLKQQRHAGKSVVKFAKLLSAQSGVDANQLVGDLKRTSGKLLVKSRIRIDCAANLAHRAWWSQVRQSEDISIHIFCDASPQWRGVELFATTVDIIVDGCLFRRLSPVVSLSKAQLDHHGKLAALLWQLFLLSGPSFDSMAAFCRAVRSLTTDMGTERLLSDSPACLVTFFEKLEPGARWPASD